MGKRLDVGSKVLCRLFNTPDNSFYGDYFTGTVIDIIDSYQFGGQSIAKGYRVARENSLLIVLKRKEIKRIIEA